MIFVLTVFTLSAALQGCGGPSEDAGPAQAPRPREASRAADFTLKTLDGQEITLSQYFGKEGVMLIFGATWCPYCVQEIPELKEIEVQYGGQGVKLLYINVQESREKLVPFAQKHSIDYAVLLDTSGAVARLYNVRGIPHTVLISKEGKVLYEGPRPSEGLARLIEKTLGI